MQGYKRELKNRDWSDKEELIPYRKNLLSLCRLAAANRIKVYLVTMPYTKSELKGDNSSIHIDQCNAIIRELSEGLSNVGLIDVDKSLGDRDDLLKDVAHFTEAGIKLKAEYIAACLSNYSIDKESFCD